MDWTSLPRRPSAIRREQNFALLSAVLSGALVAAGLIMLLMARVNPDTASRVRAVASDIAAPLWAVLRAPFDGVLRVGMAISDHVDAVERSRALAGELDVANARLRAARADARSLAQLKRLMAVREPSRHVLVTTRIAAATGGSVVRTAMLAVGRSAGIGPGLPVIADTGLIGQIVEAGEQSARVLLLTDNASRVPVIVERTGQPGIAAGRGVPSLLLTDRVGAEQPLQPGDRVVTSGDGGVFPPGVPVGVVIDPRAGGPLIRPAANPLGAGYVQVESAWLPIVAPRDTGPVFDAPVPAEARRRGAPPPRVRDAQPPASGQLPSSAEAPPALP
jgi:rod shape-determining protein MreC